MTASLNFLWYIVILVYKQISSHSFKNKITNYGLKSYVYQFKCEQTND